VLCGNFFFEALEFCGEGGALQAQHLGCQLLVSSGALQGLVQDAALDAADGALEVQAVFGNPDQGPAAVETGRYGPGAGSAKSLDSIPACRR